MGQQSGSRPEDGWPAELRSARGDLKRATEVCDAVDRANESIRNAQFNAVLRYDQIERKRYAVIGRMLDRQLVASPEERVALAGFTSALIDLQEEVLHVVQDLTESIGEEEKSLCEKLHPR